VLDVLTFQQLTLGTPLNALWEPISIITNISHSHRYWFWSDFGKQFSVASDD
jgi:hypothetical protein